MSEQPVTLEQLLIYIEKAVRGDRRLLVQLFRTLQQLAHHPTAPEVDRQLGEILCQVLMGERSPALDCLPPEVAEEVAAMLARLDHK